MKAAPQSSAPDDLEVVWTLADDPEEERPLWPADPTAQEIASTT